MTLKFCDHTDNKSLTILLVGNDHIVQPLSASILQANNKEKLIPEVKLHKCETVQQVISMSRSCAHVDYIVFCIDSRSPKVVKTIEEEFNHLSKTFLLSTRICLILGLFGNMSAGDKNMIINLRTKYQLHQLNGKIMDENSRLQLATRLIRLVSLVCGLVTGYPTVEKPPTRPTSENEQPDVYDVSTSVFGSDGETSF